ncbi:hypothetical protein Leryth_010340 [Lithospermum erythrorhizon]|nr:hypothetical protein Leryth_010340 [Lithospermum erythrorhizon]
MDPKAVVGSMSEEVHHKVLGASEVAGGNSKYIRPETPEASPPKQATPAQLSEKNDAIQMVTNMEFPHSKHSSSSISKGFVESSSLNISSACDERVSTIEIPEPNESRSSIVTSVNQDKNVPEVGSSSLAKTSGIANDDNCAGFIESGKSSIYRESTSSEVSDESACSFTSNISKPHKANDLRWVAIKAIRVKDGALGLSHFRLLKRLGCGDIGSVYLAELSGTKCYFAMKVMDKVSLASRKKLLRAQTEREILQSLDHPFLPTLYSHFETDKFSCLVMEFCPGGDLHTLRQRQPGKHFVEQAVKFYAAEILLAMEYLHMLGIVYRDLKPENILVRDDGHIMLSDFDLSLCCASSPTVVKSSSIDADPLRKSSGYCVQPACLDPVGIQPSCAMPTTCFSPRNFFRKSKKDGKPKTEAKPKFTERLV